VFNHAQFLPEAIESVLAQTYDRVETIVVDDGSTDDTAAVAARYPGVRCVRQENQGLAAGANTGLRHAARRLSRVSRRRTTVCCPMRSPPAPPRSTRIRSPRSRGQIRYVSPRRLAVRRAAAVARPRRRRVSRAAAEEHIACAPPLMYRARRWTGSAPSIRGCALARTTHALSAHRSDTPILPSTTTSSRSTASTT